MLGYGQRHARVRRIGHRKGAVDRSHGCRTVKTGQRIASSANGQDRLLAVGSGGSRCRECAIKQPGFRPLQGLLCFSRKPSLDGLSGGEEKRPWWIACWHGRYRERGGDYRSSIKRRDVARGAIGRLGL